ncbi:hypothetical protein SAY87_015377 [Trapa incisa]|uniref:Uncharacterized protein n=1 Tax=Trapa incisa TaxID=236973 RepID=A0AAN7JE11_9MYRT|nr:hypothetical protein SAY87_015377 [Trapa incisa]
MGLLDQLWDDTVAGPPPDTGLGKLRKLKTFGSGSNSPKESCGNTKAHCDQLPSEPVRITRSITIIKPPGYQPGSTPPSPAGSTPPVSPFSGELPNIFSLELFFPCDCTHIICESLTAISYGQKILIFAKCTVI